MLRAKVLVLGMTLKPGITDVCISKVLPLLAELTSLGTEAIVHDPNVREFNIEQARVSVYDDLLNSVDK